MCRWSKETQRRRLRGRSSTCGAAGGTREDTGQRARQSPRSRRERRAPQARRRWKPLLDGQSEKGVGDVQSTHLICRCFQIEDVSGLFDDVFERAQKKYNAAARKASMTIKLTTTRTATQDAAVPAWELVLARHSRRGRGAPCRCENPGRDRTEMALRNASGRYGSGKSLSCGVFVRSTSTGITGMSRSSAARISI